MKLQLLYLRLSGVTGHWIKGPKAILNFIRKIIHEEGRPSLDNRWTLIDLNNTLLDQPHSIFSLNMPQVSYERKNLFSKKKVNIYTCASP